MTWPSVWEVHAYRCQVYNLVCEVIASAPDHAIANIGMDSPYWALPMAFEHERIHIETSRCALRRQSNREQQQQPGCGLLVWGSKSGRIACETCVLSCRYGWSRGACALQNVLVLGTEYRYLAGGLRGPPLSAYDTAVVLYTWSYTDCFFCRHDKALGRRC